MDNVPKILFVIICTFSYANAQQAEPKSLEEHLGKFALDDGFEAFRTLDSLGSGGGSGVGGLGDFLKHKRLYNTSIALTASMFSYFLPGQTAGGAVTDTVNQAIYGLFGTLALCLIYAVPVLFTGVMLNNNARSARSINEEEYENNWFKSPIMKIENVRNIFDEEYRDQIGLDYKKCLSKTICEAHRAPKNKDFGLLVLPFQIFYPPPGKNVPTGRATSYQTAASDGKFTKEDCAKKYKCFFDTLDLATFLIDWYRLRNDPEYSLKDSEFN